MAIFEFTETSFIEVVWYLAWQKADWMAMVYRDADDQPWQVKYRFRYYDDNDNEDPWDGRDRKSAVQATLPQGRPLGELVDAIDQLFKKLGDSAVNVKTRDKTIIHGDSRKLLGILGEKHWNHQKTVDLTAGEP